MKPLNAFFISSNAPTTPSTALWTSSDWMISSVPFRVRQPILADKSVVFSERFLRLLLWHRSKRLMKSYSKQLWHPLAYFHQGLALLNLSFNRFSKYDHEFNHVHERVLRCRVKPWLDLISISTVGFKSIQLDFYHIQAGFWHWMILNFQQMSRQKK